MHDFDLVRDGVVFGACEVTTVTDRTALETWLAPRKAGCWTEPGVAGAWALALTPTCNVNELRRLAPPLIRRLAADPSDRDATSSLQALGVVDYFHSPTTSFPGSIYTTVERAPAMTGGFESENGDGLVRWFDEWVHTPAQEHNIDKLRAAHRPEAHLFLPFPALSSAPFTAIDVLVRDDGPLPTVAPRMPDGVTHVWFMSMLTAGAVFRWGPSGWERSPKPRPPRI